MAFAIFLELFLLFDEPPLRVGELRFEELATDPGTAILLSLAEMAIYMKNDKFVIAYNNAGTVTYLTIPLDAATTSWTQSTVAP